MEVSQEIDFLTLLLPLAAILLTIAIGVVLMNQQFQKNIIKQQLKREALKREHQKALLQKSVEVQEMERKRFAQDLHDELGAILSIGRMQLVQLESNSDEEGKIKEVRILIENALHSTRRISHELMPLQLEKLGLEKALRSMHNKLTSDGSFQSEISVSEKCNDLPWLIQIGLYRIYSELINNTLKHANASVIEIIISMEEETLNCHYQDNGKGLNTENTQEGIGLHSILNRVEGMGGTFHYGNAEQGGFYTQIRIPTKAFMQ